MVIKSLRLLSLLLTFKERIVLISGPPPRLGLKAASPGAGGAGGGVDEDCNSNTSLAGSQHSGHDDLDAHCDNSGYLWFLDYK